MDRQPCRFCAGAPLGILAGHGSFPRNAAGGRVTGEEREAAAIVRECRRELAENAGTSVREAMRDAPDIAGEPVPWYRYPEGEVYDPASHAQYFYHCHPAAAAPREGSFGGDRAGLVEHGHFHLFLRAEGMPRGVSPLVFPEQAVVRADAPTPPQAAPVKRGASDRVAHLVAVAVDAHGEPVRLFTTNRWVTGETWYRGADVVRMLDRFTLSGAGPAPLLDCWLTALVRLYRPEIEWLIQRRDEAVAKWRWLWPRRGNVLEDSRLEITSHLDIDLDARLAEIDRRASTPRVAIAARRRAGLPNMADGWGA